MRQSQNKNRSGTVIACGLCLLAFSMTKADAEQLLYSSFHVTDPRYLQESKSIADGRSRRDLSSLVKLADAIQTEWAAPKDRDIYFELSNSVVQAIASCQTTSVDDHQPLYLARKYTLFTLENHGQVPLDVEANIVTRLAWPDEVDAMSGQVSGDAWSRLRSDHMKLWFDVWGRINKALKKTVDLKENLWLSVPYMGDLDDVKAMAEHEKAVQVNNQKMLVRHEYLTIGSLKLDNYSFTESAITAEYSMPPYNTNELKQFMETAEVDDATQQRILAAVKESRARGKP